MVIYFRICQKLFQGVAAALVHVDNGVFQYVLLFISPENFS